MHEVSIAMALVDDVERALDGMSPRPTSVRAVRVRVGTLSGVDADALRQAFPIAAENTSCQDAELQLTVVQTRAICQDCGASYVPDFPFCVCETCGSTRADVTAGRDLLLDSIELDEPIASESVFDGPAAPSGDRHV